jgi:acetyltransferase-like isoleucine patch superfamily enzyme
MHALPIKIGAGANVADRCVVLAGVTLEAEGCLGSGALAAEAGAYTRRSLFSST